jgi:DNA-binding SARP family transcriptional activator
VQAYVTRLRAALDPVRSGADVVRTSARGYRLVLERADVDATAFTDLVWRARVDTDRGEPELASRSLDEAFVLWRGDPYGEFVGSGYFAAEVRRLSETRLAGLELRLVAGLALGRHAELVAEAEALCAEHPLHEGFWVQLVIALYRSGRQADALAALRRVRALLAEEVGADPGVELRVLEQQVLRQDPALAAPDRPAPVPPLPPELDIRPVGCSLVGPRSWPGCGRRGRKSPRTVQPGCWSSPDRPGVDGQGCWAGSRRSCTPRVSPSTMAGWVLGWP